MADAFVTLHFARVPITNFLESDRSKRRILGDFKHGGPKRCFAAHDDGFTGGG
jgi:hypothetical protein